VKLYANVFDPRKFILKEKHICTKFRN